MPGEHVRVRSFHGVLNRYSLYEWMQRCINAGGVPQIVTHFGGENFVEQGEILIRCWGAGREVPGGVYKIEDPELLNFIRQVQYERDKTEMVLNWLKEHVKTGGGGAGAGGATGGAVTVTQVAVPAPTYG